jgi:hypothetical protein
MSPKNARVGAQHTAGIVVLTAIIAPTASAKTALKVKATTNGLQRQSN